MARTKLVVFYGKLLLSLLRGGFHKNTEEDGTTKETPNSSLQFLTALVGAYPMVGNLARSYRTRDVNWLDADSNDGAFCFTATHKSINT